MATILPVYALVALVWAGVPRARSGIGFFVVFASLILPALAARSGGGYDLRRAFASGAVAVVAGVLISTAADLPAGPFLVVCFAAAAIGMRTLLRPTRAG